MLKNVALVVLGTVVLAFGTSIFQVPFKLVAGGMSGIAVVLVNIPERMGIAFPGFLTVDFYVWVMTIGFFIAGFVLLGKNFAMKTLISTIVYPPAFSLCNMLVSKKAFGGLFAIGASTHPDAALVVAAVFGGIIVGVGVAVSFLGGGSTGGIDIIALAAAKRFKKLTSAKVLLFLDTAIILTGAFVIGDLVITLLGIVSAFVSSIAVDKISCGGSKAFIAHIISDKYEEINRAVIGMDRTATVISCTGGYTGEQKKMLMVVFDMRQYSYLLSAVLRIDKSAFLTVHRAHEVNGADWTWDLKERGSDDAVSEEKSE